MTGRLKRRLFEVLEAGSAGDRLSVAVDWLLVTLILANVAAVVAQTVEPIGTRHHNAFLIFDAVSVAIFTVEYAARLWVCTEHFSVAGRGPLEARLRYAVSPFALIDLVAIAPFYLALFLPILDLRALRIFRLLRLLKLARYSPALATLWRVLCDERRALAAALLIMLGLLVVSATAMYHAERNAQPEAFGSIPAAMWWALATLTTVGYGDVVPATDLGRAIGGLVMLFGLGMFALPIGIIASGFSKEIRRRDFMVTWGMVARVPLFSGLDAFALSRIANLLKARAVPADTVLFHRGDDPDGMYFIAAGKAEVTNGGMQPIALSEGDFFGEMGLLHDAPRMASVRTATACRLLVLERRDFKNLVAEDSSLGETIAEVAERRMAGEPEKPAETEEKPTS